MINYETDSNKTNNSNLNLFSIKLDYCVKEKKMKIFGNSMNLLNISEVLDLNINQLK